MEPTIIIDQWNTKLMKPLSHNLLVPFGDGLDNQQA